MASQSSCSGGQKFGAMIVDVANGGGTEEERASVERGQDGVEKFAAMIADVANGGGTEEERASVERWQDG